MKRITSILAAAATVLSFASAADATGYNNGYTYGWGGHAPVTVNYHGHGHGNHGGGHGGYHAETYRVHGVGYHDHLNVRSGPGVRYGRVGALAYNAHGITLTTCTRITTSYGPSRWCLVNHNGYQVGWVNARYLARTH